LGAGPNAQGTQGLPPTMYAPLFRGLISLGLPFTSP
jgi:hypothetical protein